jgi:hypothetical protein
MHDSVPCPIERLQLPVPTPALHISRIRICWPLVGIRRMYRDLPVTIYSYHKYVVHLMTPYLLTHLYSGISSASYLMTRLRHSRPPNFGSRNGGDYITSYTCPLIHNPGWAFKAMILALPSFLSIADDTFSTNISTSVVTTLK